MGMLRHFKCGWLVCKMIITCIIFLFNYLHCAGCADILTHPLSQNVSVNSTAIFTCKVNGTFPLAFMVNMTNNAAEPSVASKGFKLLPEKLINGTITRSLNVTAFADNNNTNITCESPSNVTSNPALLLIQGLLASVGDLTAVYLNVSSVILTWTAPYTLDNVPITGYIIDTGIRQITVYNATEYILISTDSNPCNITTVSVSAVNGAGIGDTKSISLLGPVRNIDSALLDNCSTITISWDTPRCNRFYNIQNYTIKIYNDINNTLIRTASVNGSTTNYQFEDQDLFHHRYTYVIFGNNELGEGEYSNKTFSYQRVPRSAKNGSSFSLLWPNYNSSVMYKFNIPVVLECVGEAPENATVTIECDDMKIFENTSLVVYDIRIMNISGNGSFNVSQQLSISCNLTVVFSNNAGHSDPLILYETASTTVRTSTSLTPTTHSEFTSTMKTSTSYPTNTCNNETDHRITIGLGASLGVVGVLVVILLVIIVVICCKQKQIIKGHNEERNGGHNEGHNEGHNGGHNEECDRDDKGRNEGHNKDEKGHNDYHVIKNTNVTNVETSL